MALLIIGATGTLGRQIVRRALNEDYKIRCLVRNIRKARFLREWGVELIYGDLNSPQTLIRSFKGITAIIDASTCRSADALNVKEVDWDGKIALLQASKVAKVKRFIFFSVLNTNQRNYIPLMKLKFNFEYVTRNSKVPYTIFQLSGFFQGLIGQYAIPILEQQSIYTVKETVPVSYIDTDDVTIFCLKSLDLKLAENKTFSLGNPNPILASTAIQICEKLSGQKAKVNKLSINNVRVGRILTNFFQWSWNIADRLAFIELLLDSEDFKINYGSLQKTFSIFPSDLLTSEIYFQQYFEQILSKLKDLNYDQNQMTKRRDLTF